MRFVVSTAATGLLAAFLLFHTPGNAFAQGSINTDWEQIGSDLEAIIAREIPISGAPGGVVGIYQDGHLVVSRAWGSAGCSSNQPANVDDGYEIGSISKYLNALAIMQFVETGQITLETPVGSILPDLPAHWNPVTVYQLLTHTSGVPDYEEVATYAIYEQDVTPEDVLAVVADQPLDFPPGSDFLYSNTGYYLLSLVVENLSGQSFSDYMQARVFGPAGMTRSYVSTGAADPQRAIGCQTIDETLVSVRPIVEYSSLGAAGIVTTLADWALLEQALNDNRIVSADSLAAIHERELYVGSDDQTYGLGIRSDSERGLDFFFHNGMTQGFTAQYINYADQGLSTMVFLNRYYSRPIELSLATRYLLFPDIAYHSMSVPADPDPERTAAIFRGLRFLFQDEGNSDDISPGIIEADIPNHRYFTSMRMRAIPAMPETTGFHYVTTDTHGDSPILIYRQEFGENGALIWSMAVNTNNQITQIGNAYY
jgi:D-alanyl-D-alanine carboxypeptidase